MGCPNGGPIDFDDPCVRTSWSALLPATFILVACIIATLERGSDRLSTIFPCLRLLSRFLTLQEAEALQAPDPKDSRAFDESVGRITNAVLHSEFNGTTSVWKNVAIAFIALIETLAWLGVGCFTLVAKPDHLWNALSSVIISGTWLYVTCRAIVKPSVTPLWDLFVLFIIQLAVGILRLGGTLWSKDVRGAQISSSAITGLVFNLVAVICLLGFTASMPLAVPSDHVKASEIVSIPFIV